MRPRCATDMARRPTNGVRVPGASPPLLWTATRRDPRTPRSGKGWPTRSEARAGCAPFPLDRRRAATGRRRMRWTAALVLYLWRRRSSHVNGTPHAGRAWRRTRVRAVEGLEPTPSCSWMPCGGDPPSTGRRVRRRSAADARMLLHPPERLRRYLMDYTGTPPRATRWSSPTPRHARPHGRGVDVAPHIGAPSTGLLRIVGLRARAVHGRVPR